MMRNAGALSPFIVADVVVVVVMIAIIVMVLCVAMILRVMIVLWVVVVLRNERTAREHDGGDRGGQYFAYTCHEVSWKGTIPERRVALSVFLNWVCTK
jgi:ABC-type transport system involved in cytochrome bd biosynthesis fused ATPase/permease subunit